MIYDKQQPFYMAYPFLIPIDREMEEEKELQIMRSYYPSRVRSIQEKVERECNRMEYDGSMMFDEYPDKFMMHHICAKIKKEIEKETEKHGQSEGEEDLIGVLLFNEMFRRRCRKRRYCQYY